LGSQQAKYDSILSMLPYLRWVRQLSFTWFWLFGEISGNIYGQLKEIPGITFK
jgi:hypothetical protein